MSAVLDPRGGALPLPLPLPSSAPPRPTADAPLRLAPAATRRRARDRAGEGRVVGLAVVVGVHALIGWALASGLAQHVAEAIRKPIEASLLVDAPPPPPPPPPPKVVEKIREVPKAVVPPPPAYVPPPVVTPPPAPAEPVITATQAVPPPPPAPAVAPAPPAPAPAPAVVKQEVSLACPGYQAVLAQGLQDAYDRVGVQGTVRTRLTVRGTQVVDAVPVSGPKEYYKFVQGAIKRMHCSAGGTDEVQVTLDVAFAP